MDHYPGDRDTNEVLLLRGLCGRTYLTYRSSSKCKRTFQVDLYSTIIMCVTECDLTGFVEPSFPSKASDWTRNPTPCPNNYDDRYIA